MRYLIIISLLAISSTSFSQSLASISKRQIGFNYFGETYSHPGFSITYDRYLNDWYRPKTNKKGKVKDKIYVVEGGFLAGFYNHKRNHFGSFIAPSVSINRINLKGRYSRLSLFGGGMVRTINAPVFDLTDNPPDQETYSSSLKYMGGFRVSLGKDFGVRYPDFPIKLVLGSSLFFSGPFATSIVWHSAIELGFIWKIS